MADTDVRWIQRYANYTRSVANLRDALQVKDPSKLEQQGIVKAFELCYELAWKTLQDYLRELGIDDAVGPKAVVRRAFGEGILQDGDGWGAMHQARNESSHIYDESKAHSIVEHVRDSYFDLLTRLDDHFREHSS